MKTNRLKVLVACEESQAVCKAFRARGFDAYSCDLEPCSGGHPEWHLQTDIFNVLNWGWDMMIAHPTCTFLTNAGVRWLYNKDGSKNIQRWEELDKGATFFKRLWKADIPLIAVENPIPHKYAAELIGDTYDQCVQPWMFGHTESKGTCLWLKGLPKLVETDNVFDLFRTLPKSETHKVHRMAPGPERTKLRSKTYPGIADALAEQYGNHLKKLHGYE